MKKILSAMSSTFMQGAVAVIVAWAVIIGIMWGITSLVQAMIDMITLKGFILWLVVVIFLSGMGAIGTVLGRVRAAKARATREETARREAAKKKEEPKIGPTNNAILNSVYWRWEKELGKVIADRLLKQTIDQLYTMNQARNPRPNFRPAPVPGADDLKVLGLTEMPTNKETLRKAYLRKVKEVRPDLAENKDAGIALNLAYGRLKVMV